MRTTTTLFTSLLVCAAVAQSPYRPLPESDAGWLESHSWIQGVGSGFAWTDCQRTIRFTDDVMIGGITYHQLTSTGTCTSFDIGPPPSNYQSYYEPEAVVILWRQDIAARKVYAFDTYLQQEVLWYDFTIGLGPYPATPDNESGGTNLEVVALDSVMLNDGYHRTWVLGMVYNGQLQDSAFCTVIEGVGSTYGLAPVYGFQPPFEWGDALLCHAHQDFTIYPFGDMVCDLSVSASEERKAQLAVAPNPTSDLVRIDGLAANNTLIQVLDALGRSLFTRAVPDGMLDLSALRPGVYTLRITSDIAQNGSTVRVVKE